jgi:hypothetical protein
MKDVMRKLTSGTTEHVLLESTRAFIEKFTSEMVAEDMKDPKIRAWFLKRAGIDYRKAKRKIGFPATKRPAKR